MANTLNGNDLGQIETLESDKWSNLDQVTYPLSDSHEASCFDYSGVRRILPITGRKSFDSAEDLWNWVATMDALQNGDQSTIVFHSDSWGNSTSGAYTSGNFNVKVDRFKVTHVNTVVLEVTYQLILFEGEVGI